MNEGSAALEARVIGNVSVEERAVANKEGVNDVARRRSAPLRVQNNGPRRRNVHLGGGGFNAGNNDPSARFDNIRNAYSSLDRLTSAVATSFEAQRPIFESQQPKRRIFEVVKEFRETLKWRNESDSEEERTFYQSALTVLKAEMNALTPQNNNNNDTNQP